MTKSTCCSYREDQSSGSSTHAGTFTTTCNYSSRGSDTLLFWLLQASEHKLHLYRCTHIKKIYIHILEIISINLR